MLGKSIIFAAAALACAGCGDDLTPIVPDADPNAYQWNLPPGFPVPKVPASNPMSDEKVELGRWLFYDTRLSGNMTESCASCHHQERAFAEPLMVSEGSTGEFTPRNAMALVNVAYNSTYTWHSPLLRTLEAQLLIPIFGEDPIELGMTEALLVQRLSEDERYQEMFDAAFPGDESAITTMNAVRAISSFVRTMISGNSPYDKLTYQGDRDAMSDAAKRGLELFLSERLECHHCHGGFNFSQAVTFEGQAFDENGFFNTGLYNVGGSGNYAAPNFGLVEVTGDDNDRGKFRVPTLRNIAMTAPYQHDGSSATLDDVITTYVNGGRNITSGPNAGDGRAHPEKSGFLHGFSLTAIERDNLRAFLNSLTDEQFLNDPRFSDPFAE